MSVDISEIDVTERLVSFIRDKFLPENERKGFSATSPLLELGIIDSLNTAILLNFIRTEIGVQLPLSAIEADNFRNVHAVTATIRDIASEPSE
jgi:peptidyl carrier protein